VNPPSRPTRDAEARLPFGEFAPLTARHGESGGPAQAATDDASADYLRKAGAFAQQQGYLGAAARIAGADFALGSSSGNLGTGGMGLPSGAATGGLY
jgi:hypothetical protein